MSPDAYLLQVISKYKQPTGRNSKAHTTAYLLHPFIQEWAGDYLEGVYFSGSYAKETGVIGSADLDLFISLKSNTDFTLRQIYNSLHDWFSSKGFTTRKQNVSVGIQYNGLDIDLVPGRIQKGYLRYHSLYKSKISSWTQTNIHNHINIVSNSGRLNEIRVIKIWRKIYDLDFPSIYLELTVMDALKGKLRINLAQNIITVLHYLAAQFVEKVIVDPSNTNNIISNDLFKYEKQAIAKKAKQTLNQSNWNQVIW